MVTWYKTIWWIEELFRLLKQQENYIESSQLGSGKVLENWCNVHGGCTEILQLWQDRDCLCSVNRYEIFSEEDMELLKG